MTHPQDRQDRKTDQGPLRPFRIWWGRWGDLLLGVWLMAVSVVLLIVALEFASAQRATNEAAKVACERAAEFGPRLIDFYERGHVLTHAESLKYRKSIPQSCPG